MSSPWCCAPDKSADSLRNRPIVNASRVLYHAKMPALIACHSNSYGHLGGAAAIENIGSAGLEYIEFPIRTAGFRARRNEPPLVTTESTLSDLQGVERLLVQSGVAVSSCTCMAGNPAEPANVAIML